MRFLSLLKSNLKTTRTILFNFRNLFYLRRFIKNGKYTIVNGHLRPASKKNLFFYFVFTILKYHQTVSDGAIVQGTWKVGIVSKDICFFVFKDRAFAEDSYNNIKDYYKYINYPVMNVYECTPSFMCCESVYGEHYYDENHLEIIVSKLIKFAVTAKKVVKNDHIYYVQHRDPNPNNIIWRDNDIIFIDLDTIGYKSALFDYFYVVSIFLGGVEGLKKYGQRYKSEIMDILNLSHESFVDIEYDRYLSVYLLWFKNAPVHRKKYALQWIHDERIQLYFPITYSCLLMEADKYNFGVK